MTSKTQNATPFARLSRVGFSLFKTQPTSPRRRDPEKIADDDENWYIPYNGPYEAAPQRPVRHEKERDSWGDPVNGEDGDVLGDPEIRNRYGGQDYRAREFRAVEIEERKGRGRARTYSSASGRTTSSGAIDPSRNSTGTARRSTVSHGNRPIVPSFVDLDTAGGVGESPMPVSRHSKDTGSSRRKGSFTSLFTFNSGKKLTPSTKGVLSAPTTPLPNDAQGHHNNSGLSAVQPPSIRRLSSDPIVAEQNLRASGQVDQEYYNSYYSTLIRISSDRGPDSVNDGKQPSQLHSPVSEPSPALHPYAYRPPNPSSLEPPHSAPLYPSSSTRTAHRNDLLSPPGSMPQAPHTTLHPQVNTSLKSSVSTPNLRAGQRSKGLFTKGKERWLSPETWCDALLFPRPRLKIKQDSDSLSPSSGRIVSPPGSPVVTQFQNGQQIPSMTSRVLAHSRSLFELRSPPPVAGSITLSPTNDRSHAQPEHAPLVTDQNRSTEARSNRPKSFALDDLALPSPAPSLARVLEEGQILEHQRKKWQDQAIKSFQNERTRSLSRARTKSLTSKQVKRSEALSSFDFLAARGLLGNQNVIPVAPPKTRSRVDSSQTDSRGTDSRGTDSRGTVGRSSHGHSNSLSNTVSKSSKSHSRNHSRSESLGKSAVKMAKSTAKSTVHLLGCDGTAVLTPLEGPTVGLDGVLQGNGTRVIRLADPAMLPIESATTSRNGGSPTPSGTSAISDSKVGIALSTPPLQADEIRFPSHPYAQGGLSFYSRPDNNPVNQPPRQDYAGPHPSSSKLAVPNPHNLVSRHRPPPQTMLHPYAQFGSARDRDSFQSLVGEIRADSNIPPSEKMWAPLSPGHVREILPNELQYSPYISMSNSPAPDIEETPVRRQMRNSSPIFDTIGVAETLVSALQRYSRDSGLGTSEEQNAPTDLEPKAKDSPLESETPDSSSVSQRPHRVAVQYDASRPLYIQKYNAAPPARSPSPIYESPERLRVIRNDSNDSSNSSSSPPLASPLGNVDDLDNYRDLFYRPILPRNDSNASTTARVPWDVNPNGRIGSGLTSIARQLSEELEDIRGGAPSLHHSISLSSRSSLSALRQSAYSSGRSPPAESGLHFVFSNIPDTASKAETTSLRKVTGDGSIMAFKPSIQIPEDIASSRASSPTRSPLDNDELDMFRLGHVHSLATPPAMTAENRVSYTGQVAFADGEDATVQQIQNEIPPHSPLTGRQTATSHSSLQPPPLSSDPTRSSYLTSSDASRISHLSDFPAPPPQQLTPAHMSLLSSYFDETLSPSELTEVKTTGQLKPGARSRSGSVQTSRPNLEPRNTPRLEPRAPTDIQSVDAQSRRLTFGGDEEIEDLLASLSSHS